MLVRLALLYIYAVNVMLL